MHEVSIVAQLMRDIERIALENNLAEVSKVKVMLGKMRQIIPESFEFAFSTLKANTIAHRAVLELSYEEIEILCEDCGFSEMVTDSCFFCSQCQSPRIKIFKGRDIVLMSLEGELNGD